MLHYNKVNELLQIIMRCNYMNLGSEYMSFRCIMHKKAYEGRLTSNYKHKCFNCDGTGRINDGTGRKCLLGYEQFLKYCQEQEGEGNHEEVKGEQN